MRPEDLLWLSMSVMPALESVSSNSLKLHAEASAASTAHWMRRRVGGSSVRRN